MKRPAVVAGVFTSVTVVVWAGALPGALLRDHMVDLGRLWQPAPTLAVAAVLLVAGSVLVYSPGRQLCGVGVKMLGVQPGPVLVTGGWYRRLRHPQHVGIGLVSLAPALAIDLAAMWVTPVAAAVWLIAGLEPLEDRRLMEQFGAEFVAYRKAVPRWIPRLTR
jgi:protein-S-isoprenylcysteine O-methyltransferase Ste14